MKNIINKAVGLMCFSFAFPVLSANAEVKFTEAAVPKNLHVYSTGGYIYVDHLPGACSSSRYIVDKSHPALDTIVSILLAAQTAGKSVVLRYDGCVTNGEQGNVVGVYLK
ncbi:hypothetical protein [Endozoicomonas sp. ALD040]|uniref:hypothetical protein n=1 Tax=Endozoicomonas sp. ALD040 TaxID=3403079 RepID=UPI003BAE239E